jgi:DNA-binding MarR family transcriptional regulator
MHVVIFGLKRAHHGTLRITRRPLAKLGLTAARFDLLYAVLLRRRRGIVQSTLRRVLGVCRATVSRMLLSLEALGLVRRKVLEDDRRKRLVELTNRGRFRIARAHHELTRRGWAKLAIDSALCGEGSGYQWCDESDCLEATSLLDSQLNRIRHAFYDHATLEYPWSPEDALSWWDLHEAEFWDLGEGVTSCGALAAVPGPR